MYTINESNVTVTVRDMDRSIKFYQSLGLNLKARWENHYAMLSAPGVTIGLHPGGDGNNNSDAISIGFIIDDIEKAKELLNREGISFEYHDDKSGLLANFRDPDGTALYLMEPRYGKPSEA